MSESIAALLGVVVGFALSLFAEHYKFLVAQFIISDRYRFIIWHLAFERHAMMTPYAHEQPIAFAVAIEDLKRAVNTGVLISQGVEIARGGPRSSIKNPSWKQDMMTVYNLLNNIQATHAAFHAPGSTMTSPLAAAQIDGDRQKIKHILNPIFSQLDIATLA